jgi:hypothetical protein
VHRSFGILNEHIKVAVIVEDAGIEQLVFQVAPGALAALLDELAIGASDA